jgi:hypothetical protein
MVVQRRRFRMKLILRAKASQAWVESLAHTARLLADSLVSGLQNILSALVKLGLIQGKIAHLDPLVLRNGGQI